jgi:xylose isomerase
MDAARAKMDAAFEFISKLGAPFFSFHDIDIAPAGSTFAESCGYFDEMVDYAGQKMADTGIKLLWGTTNAFSHKRFMSGAATNPDPDLFRYAAAQVAHCMQKTHELGGANYVLWGGREGYETLLNTDMKRELDQLGRFMNMVVEHKHAIGFEGTLLIEPKPMEPTKHQYDYDVAAVYAFLQKYGSRTRSRSTSRSTTPRCRATTSTTRSPLRSTTASSDRSTRTPATTGWAGTSTCSRRRSRT